MAITASETFEELRRAIGLQLGAVRLYTTTSAGGDLTSVIDTHLRGGDDVHNGKWVQFYSGALDGERQQASDYVQSTGDITTDAFTANVPTAATFELWEEWLPPQDVEGFIQQAVRDATGAIFDPTEDISLHGDRKTARFDIPTTFEMLNEIQYRTSVTEVTIHDGERVFDETTDADFTQTADAEDKKYGSASLKLTIALGASSGDFVTDSIGLTDLSKYTHIEGWIKSALALVLADFFFRLDNETVQGDSTDLEILSMPAVSADTWTYFRLALANPETDTAIVSIGIEMSADRGANVVWFNRIKATKNDSDIWSTLGQNYWKIDKEARDLILVNGGHLVLGDTLIKLKGGDNPLVPTAAGTPTSDAEITEVPSAYIINRAAGMALLSNGGGPGTDPNSNRERARDYLGMAERTKRTFPMLVNVRHVI